MRRAMGKKKLDVMAKERLDALLVKRNLVQSRERAKTTIMAGLVLVDGQKVDIASYLVKAGQVISIRERSRDMDNLKELREQGASKPIPKWLELDAANLSGTVAAMPQRDDIDLTIEEHLIVEFYSR